MMCDASCKTPALDLAQVRWSRSPYIRRRAVLRQLGQVLAELLLWAAAARTARVLQAVDGGRGGGSATVTPSAGTAAATALVAARYPEELAFWVLAAGLEQLLAFGLGALPLMSAVVPSLPPLGHPAVHRKIRASWQRVLAHSRRANCRDGCCSPHCLRRPLSTDCRCCKLLTPPGAHF
eukprot:SAG11_NODE_5180_length_1638_cov_1.677063_2_plen_179_part_00